MAQIPEFDRPGIGMTRCARQLPVGTGANGSEGGLWGLAIGFVFGFALAALSGWLLMRIREE